MASLLDRILNIRPNGLPPFPENAAERLAEIDTPRPFMEGFMGLGKVPAIVHPTRPYTPPVEGRPFPPVRLPGLLVPPSIKAGRLPPGLLPTPGLRLGTLLAPGQQVRKGIDHPGRRLGHTGNPGKNVGER